jgi:hypothetical protein
MYLKIWPLSLYIGGWGLEGYTLPPLAIVGAVR